MIQPTISWRNNTIKLIDQTKLPDRYVVLSCRDLKTLWQAIKTLKVRGAPAIGVAAAFGVLLAAKKYKGNDITSLRRHLLMASKYIGTSRPTAVNLFNALNDMKHIINDRSLTSVSILQKAIEKKAKEIYETDRRVCRMMGDFGAKLVPSNGKIMTVCNAGALATVDYGTALGVMYSAKKKGKKFKVYSCETRPLLQGARLTTWELLRAKIDTTLICDNMAASLMGKGEVDAIITGADRIASNGDTANKIGTYNLAVLAKHHGVPFYVAAPFSTFDFAIKSGKQIPIEQRSKDEVLGFRNVKSAPANVKVYNPAFDVTDHRLITAIITEGGVITPPFAANIKKAYARSQKKS